MIALQFQYKPLFKISLEHNFFRDSNVRNYTIVPSLQTKKIMDHLGLIYRDSETGVHILGDNERAESLVMQLEEYLNEPMKLQFNLYIKDPLFKCYTNMPFDTFSKVFYLSNSELNDQENGKLHKNEYLSADDLFDLNEKNELIGKEDVKFRNEYRGTPIGFIELELSKEIINKLISGLIDNNIITFEYKIKFDSREIFWKYFIVPAYAKKMQGLKIVPQQTDEVSFTSAEEVLMRNNKPAVMFLSEKPIKMQEMYEFGFQLKRSENVNGGKTLIKKMQYASIDKVRPIDDTRNEVYCSEIYVYI